MLAGGFDKLLLGATSLVVGSVGYLLFSFIRYRSSFRNLPCPPHSMFWGHLKLMGEYTQKLPAGAYVHTGLTQMKIDYNLPDAFYLDLWPAGPALLICTSPDLCAIPTTKNAFEIPKYFATFFKGNVGAGFIEATNGPLWKRLHKMLAPGLTANAIKEHTGSIITQAKLLNARFRDVAKTEEVVDMRFEVGKYPFQVINSVLLGEGLSPKAYTDAKKAVDTYTAYNGSLNPFKKRQLRKELNQCFRRIEAEIEPKIESRFIELQQPNSPEGKSFNTSLLNRMLLSIIESGEKLDHSLTRLILENMNGMLVAGYGTTTDTSNYMFMLLAAFPHTLEKLRDEHNRVFDKDYEKTITMLQENPGLTNELKYTTAVINETLRMFPIAGLGIRSPPSDMTSLEHEGRVYPLKGYDMGILSHEMHYNPRYWDEPKKFDPERFMADEPTYSRHVYRPFERGLRSCLGQALAMNEMKIMLLLIVRWFDFELRDHTPVLEPLFSYTDLDTIIGKHAFQSFSYTATPTGSVNMKVSLAK